MILYKDNKCKFFEFTEKEIEVNTASMLFRIDLTREELISLRVMAKMTEYFAKNSLSPTAPINKFVFLVKNMCNEVLDEDIEDI